MAWRKRKREPDPEVTNGSYMRWLRAHRPPWVWFFGLDRLAQEQLALIGDERTLDVLATLGFSAANPEAVEAGAAMRFGTDEDTEASLAQKLAQEFASRLQAREDPATASFAGFGSRNVTKVDNGRPARGTQTDALREMLGRPPDVDETEEGEA